MSIDSPGFVRKWLLRDGDDAYESICPAAYDNEGNKNDSPGYERKLLRWVQDQLDEGEDFTKSQRPFKDVDRAIEVIAGQVYKFDPSLSNIFINKIKRSVREQIAILSNPRPFWNYDPNDNTEKSMRDQAKVLDGCFSDVYYRSEIDRVLKEGLQYAAVTGTGYIHLHWDPWHPAYQPIGIGGIAGDAYGAGDVLFTQIPKNRDYQSAYTCIIKKEVPLDVAWRSFPDKQHLITPDKTQPIGTIDGPKKSFWQIMSYFTRPRKYLSPTVDLVYLYVNDYSINQSSQPLQIGEGSWAYEVPFLGQKKLINGELRTMRNEDCMIFPQRRLVVSTVDAILYDGPAQYWHAQFPVTKITLDDWVWDFLGYSVVTEVASIQDSATSIRRALDDLINVKLRPLMVYDEKAVSKTLAETIDTRRPNAKLRMNLQAIDKPIQFPVPPQYLTIDGGYFEYLKTLDEYVEHITGLPDLKALSKAKQIPSPDSIEKLTAGMGDIVVDQTRGMERSMLRMGEQIKSHIFQFYTMHRRARILGKSGWVEEDFDYDPGNMVPQSLPGETEVEDPDKPGVRLPGVFASTRVERARFHMSNFTFRITPNSMYQVTNIQRKMLALQARKIDPRLMSLKRLAEILEIHNYPEIEEEVKKELETQRSFQMQTEVLQALLQMEMAKMAQAGSPEGQQAGAMSQLAEMLRNAIGSGEGGGGEGGNGNVGRPPSLAQPPTIRNKGDRSTLTSSR